MFHVALELRPADPHKNCLKSDGRTRAADGKQGWRLPMLDLGIERIGELGIVECRGRIVNSEAVFKLRRAVTSLESSRIIVLDLSEVSGVEGDGFGMLVFLHRWAFDHKIQLKLFNPRNSVRYRLELVHSIQPFDIASLEELMDLLANADSRVVMAA
jgi:anti-anti-sigma regulatory factor